ncbi:MAG TPA: acyltransferase, partial [Pirellulales bacterium]|nr:acyltransferase [Pirellulales bacterium]
HDWFLFGSRGVDFFFVLSGFVIAYVHWSDLGRSERIPRYAAKRFVRVYPVLWAVSIPMICASWLISSEYLPASWQDQFNIATTSLTLLPSQLPPLPDVAWTLKHEVLFYALYALVLCRPRLGSALLLGWAALCASYLAGGHDSNFLVDFLLSPYNLEFLLGVGCGWLMRNRSVPCPRLIFGLGLVGFIAAGFSYVPPPVLHAWDPNPTTGGQLAGFSLSSALIILGLAQISLSRPTTVPRPLALLGNASYSIYLIHVPAISAACKALKLAVGEVDPLVALALASSAGALAGVGMHLLVELPILKAGRQALSLEPRRGVAENRPQRNPGETPAAIRAIKEPA